MFGARRGATESRTRPWLAGLVLSAALLAPLPASSRTWAAALSLSPSLDDGSLTGGAQIAWRGERLGVGLYAEHSYWWAYSLRFHRIAQSVQIALFGDLVTCGGRARSAVYLGTSILAFDTSLDQAGSLGLFVDLRPFGFRLPLGNTRWTLTFDPLHFGVLAPVLNGLPLIEIQYRTSLVLERLL
jgi:hypothetical protein